MALRQTDAFADWIDGLKDSNAVARIGVPATQSPWAQA
jgi:putative component of toxin-antitoxin plasmid stabilization module